MQEEIITYREMCDRERSSLQRGMNFRAPPGISVVLMSRRRAAPYKDHLSEDGTELIYEGHDVAKYAGTNTVPKQVDQPWTLPTGGPTENSKFAKASGRSPPAQVRVYEKLRDGIWSDRGLFDLTRYEYVSSNGRKVFQFHMRLSLVQVEADGLNRVADLPAPQTRVIPSWVKQVVYKRDKGRCVECGAATELHFDHDLPYSLGGTGLTPENVRVLCARHNLMKGQRIQ